MLLSKSEFEKNLKNKNLRLAFIGMSNVGKSFRARQLVNKKKFLKKSIDKEISRKLKIKNEKEMAKWLGHPWEPQFETNQKKYLDAENTLTKNMNFPKNNNFVLDTTGSVIYLESETLKFLKENFLIIYLKVPSNLRKNLINLFFNKPKPLIWGNIFKKKPEKSYNESIRECYPKLLNFREKKYETLADITLEVDMKDSLILENFWEDIKKFLIK